MIQDIEPSKLRNEFIPDVQPLPDSAVFFIRDGCAAVRTDASSERPPFPLYRECAPELSVLYLFSIDDTMYFLAKEEEASPPQGFSFENIRDMRRRVAESDRKFVYASFTALHLSVWYRDNRFCGRCGHETLPGSEERSLVCPSCGNIIYPRIFPAVIVGVRRGDYLLHTKYAGGRGVSFYALIAGFAEIGETLEQTVEREVMEEVGLRVKNIRYFASQPWGIACDLLAGFYCDAEGDDPITLDRNELREAVWIHRSKIEGQPNDFSLTNHMMICFREGMDSP